MPRTELIDQLIRDDEVVCYRDFRKRTLLDLANPSDAAATLAATTIQNQRGYSGTGGANDAVTLPATTALKAANDGTVITFGRYQWVSVQQIVTVLPLFTFHFYWLAPPGNINNCRLRVGATSANFTGLTPGIFGTMAVSYGASAFSPLLYLDGEFAATGSPATSVNLSGGTSLILGRDNDNTKNAYGGILWTNRRLTETEIRQAHRELMA